MSTMHRVKKKCGLCGHIFESRELMSTNAFGSPDLDLRPPMMQRSTMPMWITKCPACGYIHREIHKNGRQHKAFIKSKDYRLCEGNRLERGLAIDFYRYALILMRENDPKGAYDAFLCAAWACDDGGDLKGAILCRNKAIALYDEEFFANPNLRLRHLDLLRRSGRFSEAIAFGKGLVFEEEMLKKILDFQLRLLERKDIGCYRVLDCNAIFMNLSDEPFRLMRSEEKEIEVRCYDEKRQALKEGDIIIFCKKSDPSKKIYKRVRELRVFNSFKELYEAFPSKAFGHPEKSAEELCGMVRKIYSAEKERKYGALAIILE